MFAFTTHSLTNFALAVTILVVSSACAQNRKLVDSDEARVIPVSEFQNGESWRDEYEPPVQYASKEKFRSRVKTNKKGKSVYTTQR